MMSLDVVRAIQKTKGEAMAAFHHRVSSILNAASKVPSLESSAAKISASLAAITKSLESSSDTAQSMARDFCTSLAHTYIAALLLEHAVASCSASDLLVLETWCQRQLCTVAKEREVYSMDGLAAQKALLYQGYNEENIFTAQFVR